MFRFHMPVFLLFILFWGSASNLLGEDLIITGEVDFAYGNSEEVGGSSASGHSVTIADGGWVHFDAAGAHIDSGYDNAMVSNNRAVVYSGGTAWSVSGGATTATTDMDGITATATGNNVIIDGGKVEFGVSGGNAWAGTAMATGNSVIITGNGNVGSINGGSAQAWYTGIALASGNTVIIDGGIATFVTGGEAHSAFGSPSATATNNTVIFKRGEIASINGGQVLGDSSGYAVAEGNIVTISGGKVGSGVTGGEALFGAYNVTKGNIVTITGGTIDGGVRGGDASSSSGVSSATGNTVTIEGGTIHGNVYGGNISSYGMIDDSAATGNIVTIKGNPTFGRLIAKGGNTEFATSTILYGGYKFNRFDSVDVFTGNTLNLYSPITVAGVHNFQYLNFFLPATFEAGETLLTATGTADISGSTVNVGIDGASSPLKAGDTVVLINAGTLAGSNTNTTANGQGMQGVTLFYEFGITKKGNQLLATVLGADAGANPGTVNPQTKSLSEGIIGGLGLLTLGADLVSGSGIGEAVGAASGRPGVSTGSNFGTFGAVSGGSLRFNSGSHADIASFSLMTGLAWGMNTTPGRLTLGAFFEYGNGSYDTYNSFGNAADVHGDGTIHNTGGGVLGRLDFANPGCGNFYTEGSFRLGGVKNKYRNGDLRDNLGRRADYDSSSAYYGVHLGAGHVWNIGRAISLDLHGKYFWTRQEGDSVTLATGDPVKFKDVDSHRVRLGGRLSHNAGRVSPYVGAAFEHEFDSKARATTRGRAIDSPTVRGNTGIGELGVTWNPADGGGFFADAGVQGYVGKREGVTGSLRFGWVF